MGMLSAHAEQVALLSPVTHETRIAHLEGRRAIIENVTRIDVPNPPEAPPQPSEADKTHLDPEFLGLLRAHRERNPMIFAGATVFRFADGTRLTHVTGWRTNHSESITFWSSADFSILAHPGGFSKPDDTYYSLLLMWTPCDVERTAQTLTRRGIVVFESQKFPDFPKGAATFQIVPAPDGSQPDQSALTAIQDIHDHYNRHCAELTAAFDLREAENKARRAELGANPPLPRDIRLKVSRLTSEQAAAWHRHHTRHRHDPHQETEALR